MRRECLRFVGNLLILATIIVSTSLRCLGLVPQVPTHNFLNNRYATIHSTKNRARIITSVATTTVASSQDGINAAAIIVVDEQQLVRQLGSAFTQKLVELEEYKNKHGDCLVPRRYEENPSLGNFVNKQRQSYRKFLVDEKSSMNDVSEGCSTL